MKGPGPELAHYRRLAGRTLPSLLRYKFLHEYGYDKGAVVVQAIVDDICQVVRNYYRREGDLEPGQPPPSVAGGARRSPTLGSSRSASRSWPTRTSRRSAGGSPELSDGRSVYAASHVKRMTKALCSRWLTSAS